MGVCFSCIKSDRRKYVESEDVPTPRTSPINLPLSDFISSISTCSEFWALSQECRISLYQNFSLISSFDQPDRIRTLYMTESSLISANKDISLLTYQGKTHSVLSGHEKVVNSISVNNNFLLSGSSDWTVRLWDIFSQTELNRNLINWNVVTSLMWKDENTAVQTSEDLRLRIWDIREKQIFKSAVINVGDNFATCVDCKDELIATGHRGCNEDGSEVKIWDLRQKTILACMKGHKSGVEGVQFVGDKVVSCGKDGKLIEGKTDGCICDVWTSSENIPFVGIGRFKEGILAANIEPKVMFFNVNPLKNVN